MLIHVMCPHCAQELLEQIGKIPEGGVAMEVKPVPVQTVGLYRTTCSKGHDILMIADVQPFELLFESAMEAFVDLYFREAVSSFAAALERFYEFVIRSFLIARKVDSETSAAMWKSVSHQSERQLGMYIGLYTAEYGRQPPLLQNDTTRFRNSVIHKGYFPSSAEAFDFGRSVYELINRGVRELRTDFADAMQAARDITRKAALSQLKDGEVPATFGMGTTISLMVLDEPKPMVDAINSVAARMHRLRTGYWADNTA